MENQSPAEDLQLTLLNELFDIENGDDEPGFAVAILIDNRIAYHRCHGLANLNINQKITLNTKFRLASLTKQFTGYGILLLEKEGRLSTDDQIGKFFDDDFGKNHPFISSSVTVQHLLDHTSGILDYEQVTLNGNKQWLDKDVLRNISDQTYFQPGSQFRYSNTGYVLLGLIIELAAHMSLEAFFHEYIFQSLGITLDPIFNPSEIPVNCRALGYIKNGTHFELCDQSPTSATRADGGLYMSLNDYIRWYTYTNDQYFSCFSSIFPVKIDESIEFAYRTGWFSPNADGRIRLHIGYSCGFTHQVFRIDEQDRKICVIYFSNIGDNQRAVEALNQLIVDKIPLLNPNNTKLLWAMTELTR